MKAALGVRQDLDVIDVTFDRLSGTGEILLGGKGLPECLEMCVPRCVPLEVVQPK